MGPIFSNGTTKDPNKKSKKRTHTHTLPDFGERTTTRGQSERQAGGFSVPSLYSLFGSSVSLLFLSFILANIFFYSWHVPHFLRGHGEYWISDFSACDDAGNRRVDTG